MDLQQDKSGSFGFNITNVENASLNMEEMISEAKALLDSMKETSDGIDKKADQWLNRSMIAMGGLIGLLLKFIAERQMFFSLYAIAVFIGLAACVLLLYLAIAPSQVALSGIEPKKWVEGNNINDDFYVTLGYIGAAYQARIDMNRNRIKQKVKLFRWGLRVLLGNAIAIIPFLVLLSVRFLKA
jgi:hypothetical protein